MISTIHRAATILKKVPFMIASPNGHSSSSSASHRLLGSRLSTISFAATVQTISTWAIARESRYVCVANVHMIVVAHDNPQFAAVLEQADLVTPDGMPLVVALRLLHGIRQERVAGMDLMPALIAEAARRSIPVYFYGSTEDVLERVELRARSEYPDLIFAGAYSPPFRGLTAEEEESVIDRINSSGDGIVFVALGCPRQEKWMARNKGKINAVMVGVGGAFPVYAGEQSRAPQWMQHCSLEWLYRLIQEPSRLFRRYLVTNTTFLFLLAKEFTQFTKPK
jgi:N-acetylglucosaminyldiphosphoundecaprenol N-acetyl-beta-D-mannosaminyltransferase